MPLFVGSHFLYVHVHSTFYRKVGLKRTSTGVEGGGACVNTRKYIGMVEHNRNGHCK